MTKAMQFPQPPAGKPSSLIDTRVIYCADNLLKLKELPDRCVDAVYIDPPFNSSRMYESFWEDAEPVAFDDRHGSIDRYIDFMRPRCEQLRRVLKKAGLFFYHCDDHAVHYIKVMLDSIFGPSGFVNEIIWKRQSAHNDAKQGSKHLGRVDDRILMYSAGEKYFFKHVYRMYDSEYIRNFYRHVEPGTGRRYRLGDLTAPGGAAPSKGNPHYEFLGVCRYWRYSKENMERLYREGRIIQTGPGRVPQYKRYLDEGKGVPVGTVWDDITPVHGAAKEAVGYPTQKPLKLLERILAMSSRPNDIVLDAFCGCGTAIVAAQLMGRQWIGIDCSPTACRVMAKRLRDGCGLRDSEPLWKTGRGFIVRGMPRTEDELRRMPHFEFESWAVLALGGYENRSKVHDMGIDGRIFPIGSRHKKTQGQFDFMKDCYPIQVKQMDKIGRPEIDKFEAAMMRDNFSKGIFVGFGFTAGAEREATQFFRQTGKVITLLTVKEMLDGRYARKLA